MLVGGQRCPIVGRVRMDQTVRDVADAPDAAVGDAVVVIGRQGDVAIDADEIGTHVETNADETRCGSAPRVPRDYVE